MSLQLILGSSGCGKTTCIFDRLIRETSAGSTRQYFLIVPDQYSLSATRDLIARHPRHGILNIDVLSFKRLAYRVFDELAVDPGLILSETGKNLLIRRAAGQIDDQLRFLKGKMDRQGFVSEIKSALSEFDEYAIGSEELEAMIGKADRRPTLQGKLRDLALIRRQCRELMRDHFITAEDMLLLLAQYVPQSELLKGSSFIFDGFTGFTPVQMKAMEAILQTAGDVTVALTIDERLDLSGAIREHELFCLTKKTARALTECARRNHVEILPEIRLKAGARFRDQENKGKQPLAFLERNLLRYGKPPVFAGHLDGQIKISCSKMVPQEVRRAAAQISELVREGGLRWREIAVVAGDLPTYEPFLTEVFRQYEIPFFVDRKIPVTLNPCLEFVRAAIEIAEENYSYESVMRFLRTGFAGVSREEADLLDNYLLARGIRGSRRWKEEWTRRTRLIDEEQTAQCNDLRGRLMEALQPFMSVFSKKQAQVSDYTAGLCQLLESFRIEEQLMEARESIVGRARQMEYEQIYEMVTGVLEEMERLIGSDRIERHEFALVLDAGFAEARIGIIPPGPDQVHIGDMTRTRLDNIRVLFFVGVNDGWIPRKEDKNALIGEADREFLQGFGYELAPGMRENAFTQRFYLYSLLTKPSEELHLSFCMADSQGAARRPAFLISDLRRMYPGLEVRLPEEEDSRKVYTDGQALARLAQLLGETEPDAPLPPALQALSEVCLAREETAWQARQILEAREKIFAHTPLGQELARALSGRCLTGSITSMETFARCPFAYFAQFTLKLQEREQFRISTQDMGIFFHQVIEQFSESIREDPRLDWQNLTQQQRADVLTACIEYCADQTSASIYRETARNQYAFVRIRRMLERTVEVLVEQIQAGSFEPRDFEVRFPETGAAAGGPVRERDPEEKVRLIGKVDRVDVLREADQVYLKVIDYKSGSQKFDLTRLIEGLQLQLMIYLGEVLKKEREISPETEVKPAGVFYSHLDDPVIEADTPEVDEEIIHRETLKALRPDGLLSEEDPVLRGMAEDPGQLELYAPAKFKKDGGLAKTSSVCASADLEAAADFAREKIHEMAARIQAGEIEARPYRYKDETGCEYCDYRSVCGYDRGLPGAGSRRLRERSAQECWQIIRGGVDR
ncbi:MAG: PD-(D/E)XK nuclease family protein [Lachnospiraceae bacterium]|nr:PD-(D/E)XK nuclease family protein [Lachnospiraceae bacterium]